MLFNTHKLKILCMTPACLLYPAVPPVSIRLILKGLVRQDKQEIPAQVNYSLIRALSESDQLFGFYNKKTNKYEEQPITAENLKALLAKKTEGENKDAD